ncbi:MAG TPA: 3-isopropylmalate dehydratase small subunit, partial [Burkholderiales bacterium]|nr:3-isopropylmalate dehydratase small subunit [Burkholderiales bacterium]
AQTVVDAQGATHRFEIHPVRKKCLLDGLDDIARTVQYRRELDAFEAANRNDCPWLYTESA